MKSNELRPGAKIVFAGETYIFTRCEANGRFWSVHLGDKIVTCTRNFDWQVVFTGKPKKKRKKMARKGFGRGGSDKGDKTFRDTGMEGTDNLTDKGAREKGKAMTHNLSAKERAKREDKDKK